MHSLVFGLKSATRLIVDDERIIEDCKAFHSDSLGYSEAYYKCFLIDLIVGDLEVESQGIRNIIIIGVFEDQSCSKLSLLTAPTVCNSQMLWLSCGSEGSSNMIIGMLLSVSGISTKKSAKA